MSESLPAPDPERIGATIPRDDERARPPAGTTMVRVHRLAGPHPMAWNELRSFGPTDSRFDHHPPPRGAHADHRIAYAAIGADAFAAAIAEAFQDGAGRVGPIDPRHHRCNVAVFDTTGPLVLLDLDSGWITRAGGNQAIRSGPRAAARAWARAIHAAHPDLDGLAYGSSLWGPRRCVALWERAERVLPARPRLHRLLDDPVLARPLHTAAWMLGTYVVPYTAHPM